LPNKYIDAAKIELRLAVPNLPKEDVTVSKNPSFAGDWKMPSKPGESFALTIENAAAHKLKAHVRAETELTYSIDRDDRASGSFKGPIGEISWQACGGEANAKIIRIGHYMVWMITVRSAGGTGSPSVAILTDAQPKQ
jgi:hypothetical protein